MACRAGHILAPLEDRTQIMNCTRARRMQRTCAALLSSQNASAARIAQGKNSSRLFRGELAACTSLMS